jgi:hypothetical protein
MYKSQTYVFGADPYSENTVQRQEALDTIDDDIIEVHGINELDALRDIMIADHMVKNIYVLSESSLNEIADYPDSRYHQDVLNRYVLPRDFDLLPHGNSGRKNAKLIEEDKFSYLSDKDRLVLQDALKLECDVFLTLDNGVLSQQNHLNRELPTTVRSPSDYWEALASHLERTQPI